jgi:hypothetical protein
LYVDAHDGLNRIEIDSAGEKAMKDSRKSFAVFVPRTTGVVHHASSEQRLCKSTRMSVRVLGKLRAQDCGEPDAIEVRMDGVVRLPGLGTQVLFRSSRIGARAGVDHISNEAMLVPPGGEIEIPRQQVRCRRERESPLAVQFTNAAGMLLAEPLLVGRAGRGAFAIDCVMPARVTVGAWVAARDCAAQCVDLAITGEITFDEGIEARVFACDPAPGDAKPGFGVVGIVARRESVLAAEQRVITRVPPSPEVSVLFRDDRGAPIGEESTLGVCIPAGWDRRVPSFTQAR